MIEGGWHKVEQVLGELLELSPNDHQEYLDRSGLTSGVRSRVEELLRACQNSDGFLERSPLVVPPPEPDRLIGSRLGAWSLTSVIGTGGMGTVYRAQRDGQDFTQHAALKVIAAGRLSRSTELRFREERRILACLEHPHVARLIDGGVAPDGSPYLVMEYVEGIPIDVWCRERGLDRRERLRLFCQVCEAVQFAHQKLVVHCDLKPANILVTRDGTPKLLDFGIARFLTQEAEATTALLRPLTPGYASPEQVRGDVPGTSSDIYSLGILLHELLTGRRPHRPSSKRPDEVSATVCEKEVEKPGTGAADLDAVILKALRKEPQRRYGSVEKLATDIQCFLEGRPVWARADTSFYRARKFAARHALSLAAAGALAVAVLIGLTASLWEARIAGRERLIAQRRFDEARRLTHAVIHEIQPKLAAIDGTVALRKMLIEKTLVYLEALGKDAADSPALMRDLIDSYVALVEVAADPGTANVGDHQRASQILQQAEALTNTLLRVDPANPASARSVIRFYDTAAQQFIHYGSQQSAQTYAGRAMEIAERLAAATPGDLDSQGAVASAAMTLAFTLGNATADTDEDGNRKIALLERCLGIWREMLNRQPSNAGELQRRIARAEKTLSSVWVDKENYPQALEHAIQARDLDREMLARNPSSPSAQMDLAFDIGAVGWAYFRMRDYPKAVENMRQNVALRERVSAANSDDRHAIDRLAYALRDLARAEQLQGDRAAARRDLLKTVSLYGRLARSGPLVTQSLGRFALSAYEVGEIERKHGREVDACQWLQKSVALLDEFERRTTVLADTPEEIARIRTAAGSCSR